MTITTAEEIMNKAFKEMMRVDEKYTFKLRKYGWGSNRRIRKLHKKMMQAHTDYHVARHAVYVERCAK